MLSSSRQVVGEPLAEKCKALPKNAKPCCCHSEAELAIAGKGRIASQPRHRWGEWNSSTVIMFCSDVVDYELVRERDATDERLRE